MKLKLSMLTAFFIGTLLFPQHMIANSTGEKSEEQAIFEMTGDNFEDIEAITETPDEYLEIETDIKETEEQEAISAEANSIREDQPPFVTVDVNIIQETSGLTEEDFEQDSFDLDEEDLTIEDQDLISEEEMIAAVDTVAAMHDEEVNIDDLLASLEEFEATNPIHDLSFSDKIKLAIEFLKIKTADNKYVIAGVSAGTILCLVCIYFAYKYHKNKTPNPAA